MSCLVVVRREYLVEIMVFRKDCHRFTAAGWSAETGVLVDVNFMVFIWGVFVVVKMVVTAILRDRRIHFGAVSVW